MDIFVAYEYADRRKVQKLIPLLQEIYGADNVWSSGHIHGNQQWWEAIHQQIVRCEIFIYCVSSRSHHAPLMQGYLDIAYNHHKDTIPIRLSRRGQIPDRLSNLTPVDLFWRINPSTITPLLRTIHNISINRDINQPVIDELVTAMPRRESAPFRFTYQQFVTFILVFAIIVAAFATVRPFLEDVLSIAEDNSIPQTAQLTNIPSPTQTALPTTLPQSGSIEFTRWVPFEQPFDGVPMILVPAGCFMMGLDFGLQPALPVHEQCFEKDFWIDKYEVTNEQYGSTGCENTSNAPNEPRNCVTWQEAHDFCASRSGRLPTEAEWEYAARGSDGLPYPWGHSLGVGNAISSRAEDYGNVRVAPVHTRENDLSWVGATDMAGNVQEWTSSLFRPYPYDPTDGREDNTESTKNLERVVRGNSYATILLRLSTRMSEHPNTFDNHIGFRCVRDDNAD